MNPVVSNSQSMFSEDGASYSNQVEQC